MGEKTKDTSEKRVKGSGKEEPKINEEKCYEYFICYNCLQLGVKGSSTHSSTHIYVHVCGSLV